MKTKHLVLVSMFTAIIAALGMVPPIKVPGLPVPIVVQNLGIMLAGGLLGRKWGSLTVILFLALAMIGFPVLTGGRGGIGEFFGPSLGYLISYVIIAFLIGQFVMQLKKVTVWKVFIVNVLIGALLCNIIGGAYMAYYLKQNILAVYSASLIYLPGDIIKGLVAAILVNRLSQIKTIQQAVYDLKA